MTLGEDARLWALRFMARSGTLDLTLPDGRVVRVGAGTPHAHLKIIGPSVGGMVLRRGLTGFAEAYMDGLVDTDDLGSLLSWGAANQRSWFDHPVSRATLPLRRLWQKIRPGRRHRRVRSMNDHYNLGNDFYASWLDETMTYSSARFATPDQSLADAQRNKYRAIADHAGLAPGMRVLEIGCGWGGFAEYAARERGCDVVGVTLSEEQAVYARKRIVDAGLADMVDIRIQDFRQVEEVFDAVVSIEMIESIDETQWPDLFAEISGSLGPGGLAAMQVITTTDDEWERYRSRADFIQQYIFPGGQLPAPKVLRRLAAESGLSVEGVETFGLDYARTLSAWRAAFSQRWEVLTDAHGLDERFRRMWDMYLLLCETGFRIGRIGVEQWVFRKVSA
ncbi:MAG: cyclopropane-fatty-acyl-phospholipid synthase family protein [Acidimicrobiia bacterium]